MPQPPDTAPDHDAPCDPALVEDVLRLLDKAVRLRQMYPAGNPASAKALEQLRAAFHTLWGEVPSVRLDVSETTLTFHEHEVMNEPEKASDSLPWTLFKDGVRSMVWRAGFEEHELEELLDILPKVRRALDHEDDVVTLLWERDFAHLSYAYIDTSSTEGAPLDPSASPGRWPAMPQQSSVKDAINEAKARAATLSASAIEQQLTTVPSAPVDEARREADAAHLTAAIRDEYDADLRREVVACLCDIFELNREDAIRGEAARHLDALMLHLCASGDVGGVGMLLRESAVTARRAPAITEPQRERLLMPAARLSDPALLTPLLAAVESADPRPDPADVDALLDSLGARALGVLQSMAATSRHRDLRVRYVAAADRIVDEHPEALVPLVGDEDDDVALDAIRRLGALEIEEAVPALGRQFSHPQEARRLAALTALMQIGSSRATSAVERALNDESSAVRVAAMRHLASVTHRASLAWSSERVRSRDVRDMEGNERRALFELYGTLCRADGVEWLGGQLIGPKGFFKRKSDPETRACAAAALGRNGSPEAREMLQRALKDDELLVRRAAQMALSALEQR